MKIAFEFDEREFSTVMAGLRKLSIDEGMALFMRLNLEAREKNRPLRLLIRVALCLAQRQ